jgi:prevent-host-death family protein
VATVSIRDLRNHGGDVVDRVLRGEWLTITRNGKPVAELRPIQPDGTVTDAIIGRWRRLPPVDATAMRDELDELVDPWL